MLPISLQIRAIRLCFMYLSLIVALLGANMTPEVTRLRVEIENYRAAWEREAEAFVRSLRS